MYCKSIQGQRLTSCLLVMAPLEAKFNVRPADEKGSRIWLKCFMACDHSVLTKIMKTVAHTKGMEFVSFNWKNEQMKVFGKVDAVEIVSNLRKTVDYVENISVVGTKSKFPVHIPKKQVILSGWQIRREDPVVLPTDLTFLRIFGCHNMRSLSDISLLFRERNEMKLFSIHDCRKIESVLDLSSSLSSLPGNPLQNLEYLWLERLDNLQMLVKVGEASVVSMSSPMPLQGIFSHLKSFRIEECSNMKHLFPFELVGGLQNLEKLVVGNCKQLEEIIASKEEDQNHVGGKETYSPTTSITFPRLRKLRLKNLPKLKSICSSNGVVICSTLEELGVWNCPNLNRMPLDLPCFQDSDRSPHCPFKNTRTYQKEWWEPLEWNNPSAKNILEPWLVLV